MQASVGDRLAVLGTHLGQPERSGIILAVHGEHGSPPYLMRWDDGHEAVYIPGSDAVVEHLPAVPPQT